jgi:dUTP pyrophosphatase
MQIPIQRLHPQVRLPQYAHGPSEDAGLDLVAVENVQLDPGRPALVPTGIAIALPTGYEAQIRPRSGLSLKGILLPNAPGTIDPGYRGEIKVILMNATSQAYQIHAGDRIAQLVVARYEAVEWTEGALPDSVRGEGGFGSSGR